MSTEIAQYEGKGGKKPVLHTHTHQYPAAPLNTNAAQKKGHASTSLMQYNQSRPQPGQHESTIDYWSKLPRKFEGISGWRFQLACSNRVDPQCMVEDGSTALKIHGTSR